MARTVKMDLNGLPTIYNLDFPVGPGMPNRFVDVLLVQALMKISNFFRASPGLGPVESSREIKVDGFFGPQTKRMIKAFEANRKAASKLLVDDGIFEPSTRDGFTGKGVLFKIIHLNRMAKEASPFGNVYNALPFNPETHPLLRHALIPGAVPPGSATKP
jgi:hypothetical protein